MNNQSECEQMAEIISFSAQQILAFLSGENFEDTHDITMWNQKFT